MSSIVIKMRDGSERRFPHEGRGGGSYTKHLRYEPGFVVIIDEYNHQTAIPAELIAEISETPVRW